MKLYASQGFRGHVIDEETGRPVRKVIWLDEAEGLLEAYVVDARGNIEKDAAGNFRTYQAKGKFRWIPSHGRTGGVSPRGYQGDQAPGHVTGQGVDPGAPACYRCGNILTLPGEERCIRCKAQDDHCRRLLEQLETLHGPVNPLQPHPCAHPGCNRPGIWSVGDEVGASSIPAPLLTSDGKQQVGRGLFRFRRGATIGRKWFCSWHWQPPREWDVKGELVQEFEDCGVRPT